MNHPYIDLHTHTCLSDGNLTPEELLICPFCGNIFPTENKVCIECNDPALNDTAIGEISF